ncbi:hypothetical protein D3C72_1375420 [compost metagenome]
MAERLHGERVEVRADPAELEHGERKEHDEDRKGHRFRAKHLHHQPDEGDGDEAQQGSVRQLAHAEPADKPCIDEGREGHEQRHARKGRCKPRTQPINALIDLFGRIDEAEQRTEDKGAGERVTKRNAVGEHDLEAAKDRTGGEGADIVRMQGFRQAEIHPGRHDGGNSRHEGEDQMPVTEKQHDLTGAGCDDRNDHEHHHDQRHDFRHLAAAIDVTHDRDGDDACRRRADALNETKDQQAGE